MSGISERSGDGLMRKGGYEGVPPPGYTIPNSFARKIDDIQPADHGCYESLQETLGNVGTLNDMLSLVVTLFQY